MTKIGVKILNRDVILDTAGRAVLHSLQDYKIQNVKVGKWIVLEFNETKEQALIQAEAIAKTVLINPLIETFQLEVI